MKRKQDDYLGDDRATQCGAYIKHRMPELTDAQARDAATMALSWIGDNPLWRKQDDADLIEARDCLDAREDRHPAEVDDAARLLMERGTPGDRARAGVWINTRKTEAEQ